jgi:hypothetical protein
MFKRKIESYLETYLNSDEIQIIMIVEKLEKWII